jgi:hypothetical protein
MTSTERATLTELNDSPRSTADAVVRRDERPKKRLRVARRSKVLDLRSVHDRREHRVARFAGHPAKNMGERMASFWGRRGAFPSVPKPLRSTIPPRCYERPIPFGANEPESRFVFQYAEVPR